MSKPNPIVALRIGGYDYYLLSLEDASTVMGILNGSTIVGVSWHSPLGTPSHYVKNETVQVSIVQVRGEPQSAEDHKAEVDADAAKWKAEREAKEAAEASVE